MSKDKDIGVAASRNDTRFYQFKKPLVCGVCFLSAALMLIFGNAGPLIEELSSWLIAAGILYLLLAD